MIAKMIEFETVVSRRKGTTRYLILQVWKSNGSSLHG